jgi:hypothetical protein
MTTSTSPLKREILLASFIALIATLLAFRSLLTVDPENYLWADDFDPKFLRWTAEWGYYALAQKHSLTLFWNAPIFFPHQNTLAYSDSLLTLQAIYSPLRLLGIQPHTALFLSLALFSIAGYCLTFHLLRKLKIYSKIECFIISYAAHFSLVIWCFLPHYQLFGFHLAPPFLLSLYLFLSRLELKWLVLAELLFVLGSCFSVYLGPSLLVLSVVVALCALPRFSGDLPIRRVLKLAIPALIISFILGAALYLAHHQYYAKMVKSTQEQSIEEIITYSANPSSIVSGRSIHSFWWKPYGGGYSKAGDWERAYFPGFLLLIGAALGLWSLMLPIKKSTESELRYLYFFAFGVGASALVLSWGPTVDGHKAPFYLLAKLIPILKNTRAMGRFGIFLGLPLGIFLVAALRGATGIFGDKRRLMACRVLGAITLILLAIESLPTGRVLPYSEPFKERHKFLATLIKPDTPVVELPCHGDGHFETIKTILGQMNGALHHHGRLVVGYSGRSSDETSQLIHLDQQLAAGKLSWSEILAKIKALGVSAVLIHTEKYSAEVAGGLNDEVAKEAGFRLVSGGALGGVALVGS